MTRMTVSTIRIHQQGISRGWGSELLLPASAVGSTGVTHAALGLLVLLLLCVMANTAINNVHGWLMHLTLC